MPGTETPGGFGCKACGYQTILVKAVCPVCGSAEMTGLEGARTGNVLEFVPVLFPPENLKTLGTYVSLLVALDNGCRTFGIFLGDPKDIDVGTRVVLSRLDQDSKALFFDRG
jgi:uncharacterized OB-fold protein